MAQEPDTWFRLVREENAVIHLTERRASPIRSSRKILRDVKRLAAEYYAATGRPRKLGRPATTPPRHEAFLAFSPPCTASLPYQLQSTRNPHPCSYLHLVAEDLLDLGLSLRRAWWCIIQSYLGTSPLRWRPSSGYSPALMAL